MELSFPPLKSVFEVINDPYFWMLKPLPGHVKHFAPTSLHENLTPACLSVGSLTLSWLKH